MKHIKSFNEYNESLNQNPLAELFDEYGDVLSVGDFGLKYQGTLIQYVMRDDNGDIHFWTDNPDTNDYAEELVMDDRTKDVFCQQVANCF